MQNALIKTRMKAQSNKLDESSTSIRYNVVNNLDALEDLGNNPAPHPYSSAPQVQTNEGSVKEINRVVGF